MNIGCFSTYLGLWSFHLLKFIPRYFIPLDAVAHEVAFLISFWDCSLLVYKNTLIFVCWFLYPTTCWICLLALVAFCRFFRVFYIHEIMSSVKRDSFTSSFLIWIPVKNFPCSIIRLGLPVQCWITVLKAGIPVLFLILGLKLSEFHYCDIISGFHKYLLLCWKKWQYFIKKESTNLSLKHAANMYSPCVHSSFPMTMMLRVSSKTSYVNSCSMPQHIWRKMWPWGWRWGSEVFQSSSTQLLIFFVFFDVNKQWNKVPIHFFMIEY